MALERHARGDRAHRPERARGRFAAAALLSGVERRLVRAYAVVIAGPLLLLAALPVIIVVSRVEGHFQHLPIGVALPLQLLVPVGVVLVGRGLRADPLGQIRFGSYAAVVVAAGLAMFLTSRIVVVGAVAAGCLAVVVAVDVAATRAPGGVRGRR